jgi:hypothetical protein
MAYSIGCQDGTFCNLVHSSITESMDGASVGAGACKIDPFIFTSLLFI